MNRVDLVVFDMIGTTVQTSPRIPDAFTHAFATAGIALGASEIDSIRGKSKIAAIRGLLGEHGETGRGAADEIYAHFKAFLLDCYRHDPAVAIPGAEQTFQWCRSAGIGIALTTGFDRELAAILVANLGWEKLVDAVVCNDDVAAGRPAPDLILTAMQRLQHGDAGRVASVGDTVADLEAGANAGVGFNIGVLSGAHTETQLSAVPHTVLIRSVAELPGILM